MHLPSLSVVICTWNRAHLLRRVVEHAWDQDIPKESFEIVVVDNGSVDETPEVLAQLRKSIQNLVCLREPVLGLSSARNAGVSRARGAIVCFLDDDAVPCRQWLRSVQDAFSRNPSAGAVGGKVVPIWESSPPAWVRGPLLKFLSLSDFGDAPMKLPPHSDIFGVSACYRKSALAVVGGFPVQLGRKGASLISGEEILVNRRIREVGFEVVYEPRAAVSHWIPTQRLGLRWFARRAFAQGESDAILMQISGERSRVRIIVGAAIGMSRSLAMSLGCFFIGSQDAAILPFLRVLECIGRIRGAIAWRFGVVRGDG